uniref:Uncharacterized protein n=1 Tax=Cacopsylla melanoneura TaxID=428564 RepID=A0A8D8WG13_9HEMI
MWQRGGRHVNIKHKTDKTYYSVDSTNPIKNISVFPASSLIMLIKRPRRIIVYNLGQQTGLIRTHHIHYRNPKYSIVLMYHTTTRWKLTFHLNIIALCFFLLEKNYRYDRIIADFA